MGVGTVMVMTQLHTRKTLAEEFAKILNDFGIPNKVGQLMSCLDVPESIVLDTLCHLQ